MDTPTLVTTTIAILTQAALILKNTRSLLDNYGEDVKTLGKRIFETVSRKFGKSKETGGELDYFLVNPEQQKRQQVIVDSLTQFLNNDQEFRREIEELLLQYQSAAPSSLRERLQETVNVTVDIGGSVDNSRIYSAGRDVNVDSE